MANVTGNLDKLQDYFTSDLADGELEFGRPARFDLVAQIADLRRAIDETGKSSRWKLRARVGERVPWYVEPEEVTH